jgi:hypothetical protein
MVATDDTDGTVFWRIRIHPSSPSVPSVASVVWVVDANDAVPRRSACSSQAMLFHGNCAARFSFNDGFGRFHATPLALARLKVKLG